MYDEEVKNQWHRRIDYYTSEVSKIKIPSDLTPGSARVVIGQISNILLDVIQDYHILQNQLSSIEQTISIIEKKNMNGSNAEQRKQNATIAVENIVIDGKPLNLYNEKRDYEFLVARIQAIKDVLAGQQSLLVSMNGFMKLEKDVYGNTV